MNNIWTVEWKDSAKKQLLRLDPPIQKEITSYLRERISGSNDPTMFGKGLKYNKVGLWSYRVGDYRIICKHKKDVLVVLVVDVGNRKDIYKY